jgi:hypothetical protein
MTNGQWLVVVALAFVWGWLTADWRRDSLELAINSAAQVAGNKSRKEMLEIASESARSLEDKLEALESGRPKEIRNGARCMMSLRCSISRSATEERKLPELSLLLP